MKMTNKLKLSLHTDEDMHRRLVLLEGQTNSRDTFEFSELENVSGASLLNIGQTISEKLLELPMSVWIQLSNNATVM
ncbi:hypothetical protein ACFL54_06955 [Planctomycetota bacterium]